MRINEISRRYAKAIYELAKERNEIDRVMSELKKIEDIIIKDKFVYDFIKNPLTKEWDKEKVFNQAFENKGFSLLTFHSILTLARRNRLRFFSEIVASFEEQSFDDKGIKKGEVRSAYPLAEMEKQRLEKVLQKKISKKVILDYKIDQSLIGGIVASVGSLSFDDSIETHLKKLNEEVKRSSH